MGIHPSSPPFTNATLLILFNLTTNPKKESFTLFYTY
jgi:hypothetical protein